MAWDQWEPATHVTSAYHPESFGANTHPWRNRASRRSLSFRRTRAYNRSSGYTSLSLKGRCRPLQGRVSGGCRRIPLERTYNTGFLSPAIQVALPLGRVHINADAPFYAYRRLSQKLYITMVVFYNAEFIETHKKLNITMEKSLDMPFF